MKCLNCRREYAIDISRMNLAYCSDECRELDLHAVRQQRRERFAEEMQRIDPAIPADDPLVQTLEHFIERKENGFSKEAE